MDRDQARRRRALRPFADPAEMAGIAQRDRGEPGRLRLRDADVDRLRRDRLAEAVVAVDDGEGGRVDDAGQSLIGRQLALERPVDIARHADDAVAVVAGEIGADERGGNAARLLLAAADAGEDFGTNRSSRGRRCGVSRGPPGFRRRSRRLARRVALPYRVPIAFRRFSP